MALEPSLISTGNSTEHPLGIGETFTGAWEQNNYPNVGLMIKTDADCTVFFDFSPDRGNNVDSTFPVNGFSISANIPDFHTAIKLPRWFRIRIVNGDSAQTFLRAFVCYGDFGQGNIPLNQSVQNDADATLVRSTEYHSEVAMGLRNDRTTVNKFGYNLDVDIGNEELIASWGPTSFNPQTDIISTAQTFTITYDNATDGATATGARFILISYLDSEFNLQEATHVLGSTGSDITSFEGLGINRAVCVGFGGAIFNVTDIDITATIDGTIQAQIPAENNVTQQCIYHTPIGHNFLWSQFLFNSTKLSGGGQPEVTIKGYSYSRVTLGRYEIFRLDFDTQRGNSIEPTFLDLFPLGGREVIYFTAQTDSNDTIVNFRFSGILEKI